MGSRGVAYPECISDFVLGGIPKIVLIEATKSGIVPLSLTVYYV